MRKCNQKLTVDILDYDIDIHELIEYILDKGIISDVWEELCTNLDNSTMEEIAENLSPNAVSILEEVLELIE